MKHLFCAVCASVCLLSSAELKIATVNMIDLVRLHPSHETNRAYVKSSDKDFKDKLDQKQAAAREIAEEGKKLQNDLMNPMLSESAKAKAQKKMEEIQSRFLAAQQELRSSAQVFQSQISEMEARLLKIETDSIRVKIEAYAREKGFDIIADSTMLAFASEKLDVTDDILRLMKVDPAARHEKDEKSQKK